MKRLLGLMVSSLLLSSCSLSLDSGTEKDRTGPDLPAVAAKGSALQALNKLKVKGRAPMTNYDRSQFGSEWDDSVGSWSYSNNGCDTRNDILKRDLTDVTYNDGSCDVAHGTLRLDPYSGEQNYVFDSNDDDYATDLDIEHIVALGNAWVTGAQQLSPEKRAELANDPINLMAVNPSLNRQKSDADFATWLPPNKSFRCSYAARQIRVKTVYNLWVTAPEKAALQRVLATCPNEPLAQPDPQAMGGEKVTSSPKPKPKPNPTTKPKLEAKPKPATKPKSKLDKQFSSCTALHDAGFAGNYVRGKDKEYAWYDDRDGDGRVCES